MENETMTMLVWATEHPYLYTGIKMKAALVAVAVSSMVSGFFKYKIKMIEKNRR